MRDLQPQCRVLYHQVYLVLKEAGVAGAESPEAEAERLGASRDVENRLIVDMSSVLSMLGFGSKPPSPLSSTPPTQRPGSRVIGSHAEPSQAGSSQATPSHGGRKTRGRKTRGRARKTRGKTRK